MALLKIRVYRDGGQTPERTITVPLGIVRAASKLIPKSARVSLEEQGIDLNQIVEMSRDPSLRGTLVEVEEHQKGERTVISIEDRAGTPDADVSPDA